MIIVDAGPLYALADHSDRHHATARAFIEGYRGLLVIPALIIPEVAHFLGTRLGSHAEVAFAADVASGEFLIDAVEQSDWLRIAQLTAQYRDLRLGMVDASVIACAERLGVTTIATTDRRHFSAVKPRHVEAFELVP